MKFSHYRKWRLLAPLGLALLGLGQSLIGEATLRKKSGGAWFSLGTFGLIVFNAGIAVFGDAIKHRTLYEVSTLKTHKG